MISRTEMERFSIILDDEYDNEIKPILLTAVKSIDSIFSPLFTIEFREILKRNNSPSFKFDYIDDETRNVLTELGYSSMNYNGFEDAPRHKGIWVGAVGYFGYYIDMPLWGILSRMDSSEVIMRIRTLKDKFNRVKTAYEKLNKDILEHLAGLVKEYYDRVMCEDAEADRELCALFGDKTKAKTLKFTISVEVI